MSDCQHIMVDLETFDTAPTAVIVSIGAVAFDPYGGPPTEIDRAFYRTVETSSALQRGCTISGETLVWWFKQSPDAQQALVNPPQQPMLTVLMDFYEWLPKPCILWCHSSFDEPILRHAFLKSNMKEPWTHRNTRDVRTVVDFSGIRAISVPKPEGFVEHNALWDAIWQVQLVQAAYRAKAVPGPLSESTIPGSEYHFNPQV